MFHCVVLFRTVSPMCMQNVMLGMVFMDNSDFVPDSIVVIEKGSQLFANLLAKNWTFE